jgi:hypothetical protein
MDDVITRFLSDLVGRVHGPLAMRLWLQPLTAMALATRDGVKDARQDKPPYVRTIFKQPEQRRALLREGSKALGRVLGMAAVMDAIYQLIVFKWIHPIELLNVVVLLAFLPYLLLRGPVNRIARRWHSGKVRAA